MSRVQCDVDRLTLAINQIGDRAVRGIAQVMREEGENIRDLARSYAPVDDGYLEQSIVTDEDRHGAHGRLQVYVFINENMAADRGKLIRDYAILMHEGLAPYGSGAYQLGPRSRAKALGGNKVGGKFLERAAKKRLKPLMQKVQEIVRRSLR